jgi:hypothetical protein
MYLGPRRIAPPKHHLVIMLVHINNMEKKKDTPNKKIAKDAVVVTPKRKKNYQVFLDECRG